MKYTDIEIDQNDNIYVFGKANTAIISDKILIIKYDENGHKIWSKTFGDDKKDFSLKSGTTDNKGNIYVTGKVKEACLYSCFYKQGDIFISKFSDRGMNLWTKYLSTEADDSGSKIITDSEGNVLVAGYTNGSLLSNRYKGSKDVFLAKYTANGNRNWVKQLGTSTDEEVGDIQAIGNEAYLAITTNGNLGNEENVFNESNLFITKYSSSGEQQFIKNVGSRIYNGIVGLYSDDKISLEYNTLVINEGGKVSKKNPIFFEHINEDKAAQENESNQQETETSTSPSIVEFDPIILEIRLELIDNTLHISGKITDERPSTVQYYWSTTNSLLNLINPLSKNTKLEDFNNSKFSVILQIFDDNGASDIKVCDWDNKAVSALTGNDIKICNFDFFTSQLIVEPT